MLVIFVLKCSVLSLYQIIVTFDKSASGSDITEEPFKLSSSVGETGDIEGVALSGPVFPIVTDAFTQAGEFILPSFALPAHVHSSLSMNPLVWFLVNE